MPVKRLSDRNALSSVTMSALSNIMLLTLENKTSGKIILKPIQSQGADGRLQFTIHYFNELFLHYFYLGSRHN